MTELARSNFRPWFWAGAALTAFKLWLICAQPVYAIGNAAHDDRLFVSLAEHLVRGEWLGPYSQMTLMKGPFYSMWIAAAFVLGIPLLLSVQMAYAGACALLVRAGAPGLRSGGVQFLIYAFLLWNPMSFESPTLGRVIRQQIYTPLELAVIAGLIAVYYRRESRRWCLLPWSVLAGLSFGCFWLTREESIWLFPTVLLLAGAALFFAWRESRRTAIAVLSALGVTIFCAIVPIFFVSLQNYRHYQWFGTVEFRASEFKDAYGAMVRVKIGPELDHVPVTRQAREAIYAVSPTFAKLQAYFEGDVGSGWAGASEASTKLPAEERQIGSGWLMWALRDTVNAAGYCHNAREALDFYRRMADEINQACDDGRLPAYPARSGFLPRWTDGETTDILRTVWAFTDFVAGYKSFSAHPLPSIGSDDDALLFHDLTRDKISPAPALTTLLLPNQAELDEWKISVLHQIGKSLRQLLLTLFLIAHPIVLLRIVQLAWTRTFSFPVVIAAAAWGGSLAYLLVNAIVQVTSFSVVAVSTFWPIYPLLQLFTVAVFWDAISGWFGRFFAGKKTGASPLPAEAA